MNNITSIGGHVLLTHQPDWSVTPKVSRLWRSPVDSSLDGDEDRTTARDKAWLMLNYQVMPFDQVERARFDERFQYALKVGKMAVPQWGKGVTFSVAVAVAAKTFTLSRSNHGFTVGQYLFVQPYYAALYDVWDVCLITAVAGATVTVNDGLGNSYSDTDRVWPILFGRPIPNQFAVMNSSRSVYQVSIQFDQRIIKALAYDDFSSYSLGPVTAPLNGGIGWGGPWVFGQL